MLCACSRKHGLWISEGRGLLDRAGRPHLSLPGALRAGSIGPLPSLVLRLWISTFALVRGRVILSPMAGHGGYERGYPQDQRYVGFCERHALA